MAEPQQESTPEQRPAAPEAAAPEWAAWGAPPWVRAAQGHHAQRHFNNMPRRRKRHGPLGVLIRLTIIFGILATLLSSIGAVGYNLWHLAVGQDTPNPGKLFVFILLLFLIPSAVGWMGRRTFRSIAKPIADVMAAADAVAQGDLGVRVAEGGRSEFNDLARSFNHMVAQLQEEDRRRRNLTADVAHELRTPLQIIQGNLEGVIDGVYAPTPEHLSATLDETRHLARLVDDLRVLSQAEAGQLSMQREPVDLIELMEDVATSFSGRAEEANIQLVTDLPHGAPPLHTLGDYGRLDQVLSNLMANALRHTPPGGRITLALAPAPEGWATLAVVDTGEGIAADALPFVFDRFYRADAARTRSAGGSGLGLAIARQLVLAHGGRIDVRSQPGQGSTFTVELPLLPPPA